MMFPNISEFIKNYVTKRDYTEGTTDMGYNASDLRINKFTVMKKQNEGTIINIGSSASIRGFKNGSVYAASKFAVRALSQCWQAELRPHNIRVCQVNPSEVTTAFAQKNRKERAEMDNKLAPEEIAHTIVSVLEMRNKGFVPEVNIWATNPF